MNSHLRPYDPRLIARTSKMASSPPPYTPPDHESIPYPEHADIDLVLAIDFGTTYSGVAYRYLTIDEKRSPNLTAVRIEKDIRLISTWPGRGAHTTEKGPTAISYRPDGQVLGWGYRAKDNHPVRIAHFKLGLQNVSQHYRELNTQTSALGGFLTNPDWVHPSLPSKKAVDYAADFLRNLREYAVEQLSANSVIAPLLQGSKVSYVITVPAIWTDRAKALTRDAAQRAGIPTSALNFIAEPEAAALYCATISREVSLGPRDKFVICDAGGGTVVLPSPRLLLNLGSYILRNPLT
jgi:molecular chaperone DnaK (HSP70)